MKAGVIVHQLDVKLLQLLQSDARMTISELSSKLSLSRPSVSERLHRLQEKGIIEGYSARVSLSAVGKEILLFIQVSDLKVTPSKFETWIQTEADILECHRVTGLASYLIKAAVSGMDEFQKLIDRFIPMGSLQTSVVLASPVAYTSVVPSDNSIR